jgi:hypothetical protein
MDDVLMTRLGDNWTLGFEKRVIYKCCYRQESQCGFPALRAVLERHLRISVGSFSNHQFPPDFKERSGRNSVGRANLADRCAVTVRYPTQCFTSLHDVADRFACFGKISKIIAREHERVGPKGKIFEINDVIRIERLPAKTYLKMQMASG